MLGAMALLAASLFGWAASGRPGADNLSPAPKRPLVESRHLLVRTARGSFCFADGGEGLCADYHYPLDPKGRLPVRPRGRVVIHTWHPAQLVKVGVVHVEQDEVFERHNWTIRAKPIRGGTRRWRFRLPRELRNANTLDIFIRYKNGGDGNFWGGIRALGR